MYVYHNVFLLQVKSLMVELSLLHVRVEMHFTITKMYFHLCVGLSASQLVQPISFKYMLKFTI